MTTLTSQPRVLLKVFGPGPGDQEDNDPYVNEPYVRLFRVGSKLIIHRHDHFGSGGWRTVQDAPADTLFGLALAHIAAQALYECMIDKHISPHISKFLDRMRTASGVPESMRYFMASNLGCFDVAMKERRRRRRNDSDDA